MTQDKYIVLKNDDAQRYLTPEQQEQLVALLQAVAAGRTADGKRTDNPYFVLNMVDRFAQPAIEAYIDTIVEGGSSMKNPNVAEALRVARGVRQSALMNRRQRDPD